MAKPSSRRPRGVNASVVADDLVLLQSILERIDCPLAFAASYKLACGDYRGAAELRCEPRDFDDPRGFAINYAVTGLVSKFPGFPGASTRQDAAIEKFLAAEASCKLTNERFRNRSALSQELPEPLKPVLWRAKEKVRKLLGSFTWDKVAPGFNWGPGATTSLSRERRHGSHKFGHKPDSTIDNLVPALACINSDKNWFESAGGAAAVNSPYDLVRLVEGNRITTVPKDSFVDRVIAIEPDMNMFIQKGFGAYFRKKLKHVSIDLDDQSRNQHYAYLGSKYGTFATIDLSSASDMISFEVVKFLLPYDWFEALLYPRSAVGLLPSGEWITYEKFSSMGNGYTFELESMIFWALAEAVVELHDGYRDVAVFGDDIIVDAVCYADLCEILTYCGFKVNSKKSFASGPFRESCGKHYFQGFEVTPPRITKRIKTVSDVFIVLNKLIRFASRLGSGNFRDCAMKPAVDYLLSLIPHPYRGFRIPDGVGDLGIVSSFDEARPKKARHGKEGWEVKVLRMSTRDIQLQGLGPLLYNLHVLGRTREQLAARPSIDRIDSVNGFVAKQLVAKWNFMGPWVDIQG